MVTVAELYHMLQDEVGVEKMKIWCMENPDSYAARKFHMFESVILQILSQLEALYTKGQANTIITNCDHLLYLGGQDINTASYIGHRSNKTEDNVMLMPAGKAYFIERGKRGILIDRVPPYEDESLVYDDIFDEDELIFGEDLDFNSDMPF